ncbi:LPD1 domain-containing protein [Enterococcus cecorum]|uniref:LPD1 domain-containing protein n=1 Tax=Enterococcus cecorum TaxID=44008 RepID=UPI001FAB807F|nr:LPD1 domain-containing protein [Enterococcus cecorum]
MRDIFIYPSYVKEKDKRDFMYDQVVDYIQSAYDAVRQREYAKRIQQDLKAEVYETKKHIKVSTQKVMDSTPLLKHFKYVEIDNEVDLNKYQKFEKELNTLLPHLPQAESQAELRLRKLGRHKALGLFVPDFNTIVVDFRSSKDTHVVGGVGIQSFIHEYGHYLDFNFDEGNLSLSSAFQPIVKEYQKELNKETYKEFFDMQGKDGKYDLDYYTIPTEVFARAFELYTHEIGLRSNLMHTDMLYRSSVPYKAFTPENRERITQYFDQQFPDYRQKIQDLVKNNEIDKVNTKSERPKEKQYLLSYGRNFILLTDSELNDFGEKAALKTVKIDDKSYEVITAKEKSWEKIQKLAKTYATPERTFTMENLESQAQEMLIVMPNDFSKEGILLSEKNRQEENIQLVASRRTKLLGNHLQAIFIPSNEASMQKVMEKIQGNEQVVQLSPVNKAPVQFKPVAQKMQEQEENLERE